VSKIIGDNFESRDVEWKSTFSSGGE